MNPNEIKKALECCTCPVYDCDSCPLYGGPLQKDCVCGNHLMKNALAYINQLEAEVERLKRQELILNQKRANIFEITNAFERGRKRGIQEFAERLKENCMVIGAPLITNRIDNLVKEMVGDAE